MEAQLGAKAEKWKDKATFFVDNLFISKNIYAFEFSPPKKTPRPWAGALEKSGEFGTNYGYWNLFLPSGKTIENVLPSPKALSNWMEPPWASMASLQKARPTPVEGIR